jgi:hypothetical protein
VLVTGVCLGYLVLPMVLVQFIGTKSPAGSGAGGKMGAMERFNVRGGRSTAETASFNFDSQAVGLGSGSDLSAQLAAQYSLLSKQSIPTSTTPIVMVTPTIPDAHKKRILVTGGSGFVGSHLVDKLMMEGHEVVVADNFFTGQKKNVEHWMHHPNFRYAVRRSSARSLTRFLSPPTLQLTRSLSPLPVFVIFQFGCT